MLQRQPQLNFDYPINGLHICTGEASNQILDPCLRYGHQLIGHRLAFLTTDSDDSFTWVDTTGIAGQRHDLDTVERCVRGIVANNNGWPGFADFAAYRRIEINPPDLATAH